MLPNISDVLTAEKRNKVEILMPAYLGTIIDTSSCRTLENIVVRISLLSIAELAEPLPALVPDVKRWFASDLIRLPYLFPCGINYVLLASLS